MLVEIWSQFIALLNDIRPMCKPAHMIGIDVLIAWGKLNEKRHHGIIQANINKAIEMLKDVQTYLPSEWVEKLEEAIYFLKCLNDSPDIEKFETKVGCEFWGFYWYDKGCHSMAYKPACKELTNQADCINAGCYWYNGSCHKDPKPVKVLECKDHKTKSACEAAHCYWYNNACHSTPEAVLPPEPVPTLKCEDYTSEAKCLAEGCYWYDGACHGSPKEPPIEPTDPFKELAKQMTEYCKTIPITQPVKKGACNTMAIMLNVLSAFFSWQRKSP